MKNGKSDCPFCDREGRLKIITSNHVAFAIFDNYPVSNGHVLVIPRRHCSNYFELTMEEQQASWTLIAKIQGKLTDKYKPDGYNIGVNIGKAAGQTIEHVHLHLIPRYNGDMENPKGGIRHCVDGKGYY